jgi:predicted transcriptional regulator YdeE
METFSLDSDIKVFYVTAASFPEGILDAHVQLHKLVPFAIDRNYFGLSRPEDNGGIIYRAAAEEKTPGETEKYHLDTLTLKKGKYIYKMVMDFRNDQGSIERAFQELLTSPGLDPQGYCVEWYANDKEEVRCMIRLKD